MATNFPTSIDALVNPIATDSLATVNHAEQHANANDAIEALEAKVGVTNSAVTSSLDYRVRNIDATTAIVSGSTSTDLVRITQGGTGNALVVEDSTNPDGTPFIINNIGSVLLGTTSTRSVAASLQDILPSQIYVEQVGASTSPFTAVLNRNDTNGVRMILGKSRGTTAGAVTALSNGDSIGQFMFAGADGTTLDPIAAQIRGSVDGAVSTGVVPGRIAFSTADSSGTLTERMRIDSNGNIGVGGTPSALTVLNINKPITGGTNAYTIYAGQTIQPDVTSNATTYSSNINTAVAAFTLNQLYHYRVFGTATPGAGSTITSQVGFIVDSSTTGAANNFGFRSQIPTGAGNNWNLYMDGNAPNYMTGRLGIGANTGGAMLRVQNDTAGNHTALLRNAALQTGPSLQIIDSAGAQFFAIGTTGNVGIGTVLSAGTIVRINKPITGGTNPSGYFINSAVDGDFAGLTSAVGYQSSITASGSTAVPELTHILVTGGTSTTKPTVQNGFFVSSSMSDGVTNRGFVGGIIASTDRWNLYMSGTAQNYLAGNTGIGVTVPTSKLHVVGSFSRGAPVAKTANFTVVDTDNWIICAATANITATLPDASTQVGREIMLKNIAAFTVVSATANIVPLAGGTATNAILPATAGSWVTLVSNGTNWVIMQS
jgi:hypothetical protein